ncbi:SAM-dependent methyltransferase [Pseudofrankia sp. DC12]|uniref:SAM-dependent methyltransferase n=1 Tax=Pseudofrankia sp. DC12 TaxID=683315 RepID=UPI0006965C46|nr:SAM-dependent methyltransferase [Pseudofrankia sp. DC12]
MLILFGVMANVIDDDEAYAIVRKLVGAAPSGSYLALNDGTASPARDEAIRRNPGTPLTGPGLRRNWSGSSTA